jgi:hypothetical protein
MITTTDPLQMARHAVTLAARGLQHAEELWQLLAEANEKKPGNEHMEHALELARDACNDAEDYMLRQMKRAVSLGVDPEEYE